MIFQSNNVLSEIILFGNGVKNPGTSLGPGEISPKLPQEIASCHALTLAQADRNEWHNMAGIDWRFGFVLFILIRFFIVGHLFYIFQNSFHIDFPKSLCKDPVEWIKYRVV